MTDCGDLATSTMSRIRSFSLALARSLYRLALALVGFGSTELLFRLEVLKLNFSS